MGTTSEKLTYLAETKSQLKETINYAGAGLTDETFRQYPSKLYDKYLDILKDNGEALFNGLPKATGTGTSLSLNDTANTRMKMSLAPSELEQETTTGKNLFSGNYSQFDSQGGTGNLYGYFKLPDDNKKYTLSMTAKNNYSGISNTFIGFTANGGDAQNGFEWLVTSTTSATKGQVLTLSNSTNNYRYISIYTNNGSTITNLTDNFYIQLEEGVTATSYEEYTGGIASPNPDYPQDIHTISGDNEIVVKNSDNTQQQTLPLTLGTLEYCKIGNYEDEFVIPSGKNKFNYLSASDVNNTVSGTYRTYEISGLTANAQYNMNNFNFSTELGSGQTISLWSSSSYTGSTKYPIAGNNWHNSKVDFTANSEGKIYLAIYPNDTTTWENIILHLQKAQIEEGSTATPYEPYPDGKWYLKKNIGKVILTGSEDESWSNHNTLNNISSFRTSLNNFVVGNIFSNRYQYQAWSSFNSGARELYRISMLISGTNYYLYISQPNENVNTLELMKQWLSNNNLVIYYQLSTPTYTPLNDTLQQELNNINKALSYGTQTNISQVNNDLPFVISASAIKKYELNEI